MGARLKSKVKDEMAETLANFVLPDSLPCSELEFPVLIKKKRKVSWKAILAESEKEAQEIKAYEESKRPPPWRSPFMNTECDYIQNEVFPVLLPALEEALVKAKIWESLIRQKYLFNGIDHVAQELWNNNPRHPNRKAQNPNLHIFNMPWVRDYLYNQPPANPKSWLSKKIGGIQINFTGPRHFYPKSWLWPEDYAATLIQKTVRQYFVQREEEVQEMRIFWQKLELEKVETDLTTNPFLARKFASHPALRSQSRVTHQEDLHHDDKHHGKDHPGKDHHGKEHHGKEHHGKDHPDETKHKEKNN